MRAAPTVPPQPPSSSLLLSLPAAGSSNPHLLVIDDDPAVLAIVAGIGRAAGFDVSECDGAENLDACLAKAGDLIILDLVMPVVDGIEIIERLSDTHSAARLVLVSGQDRRVLASASRLATARGLKVAAVFAKPFNNTELRSCLAEQKTKLSAGTTARLRRAPVEMRTARIAQAVRDGEIVMYYQPQVSVKTLDWVGVEALVRWQHPEFGLLPPDTFVPVVERDRMLMSELTLYVIDAALRGMAEPALAAAFEGRIGINVPADMVAASDFPDRLVALAAQRGIAHERLVLEVTETTLPPEPVRALAIQTRLRMRGVSLAVDDFGTGHSSLERLHTFPMDELKIDLHFVRESISDPEARAIVQNSIALARALRVRCVAEGVENIEALRLLSALRCGYAQGYFVGRPMPAGELCAWKQQWQSRAAQIRPQLG